MTRAKRTVRMPTAAQLAVGASVLAFPATAVAVTAGGSTVATPQVPATTLHSVRPLDIGYDHRTVIRGSAPAVDAGERLELEYRPMLAARWRTVATGEVHDSGRFALATRLVRSGQLQVVPAHRLIPGAAPRTPGPAPSRAVTLSTGTRTVTTTSASVSSAPALGPSPLRRVNVRPELALAQRVSTVVVGRSVRVSGRLLPGLPGRRVLLEARHAGRWIAVATARTHRSGAFTFRYTPAATGEQALHAAFAGDRVNGPTASRPERISGMQYAEVSWYEDAGNTACGFHATYGIASRTLPCGAKVSFKYGGRSVVATVDDRGPFVYSRLFDLDQTTAAALGMDGVATVLASV